MGNTRLDGRDSLDGVALALAFYCAILMSTRVLTHHNKIRSIQGETPSYKLLSRTFDYRHIYLFHHRIHLAFLVSLA